MSDSDTSQSELNSIFREVNSDELNDRYDIRKLFLGLRRHIPLMLTFAVLGGLFGIYTAYYLKHTFKAEAIVIYQEDKGGPSSGTDSGLTHFNLATAVDMIKVPANLQAVKAILGLDLNAKDLDGMTEVPPPKSESNLIYVVARGTNPQLVVDIANTLARSAVKSSQDYNQHQLQLALDNYKAELENMRRKLASQSQDIEEFKKNHQYFEMTADYAGLLNHLKESKANYQAATMKYSSLLIEYENLKRENDAMPDRIPLSSEHGGTIIDQKLSSLEAALAEARARYAPENPKVKILENQLRDMMGQTKSTEDKAPTNQLLTPNIVKERITVELMRMQGKVRAAEKIKQDLDEQVKALDKQLGDLPTQQMNISRLLTSKQITEEQVRNLNAAVENTQLLINIPKGTIEIFQEADKAKPLREGLLVTLLPLIASLLGLGMGAMTALFLEMRDDHFWTCRQISLKYTIPCLMAVPKIKLSENDTQASLFYIRILAERLEKASKKSRIQHPHFSVSITSSLDGEGKSWMAYHLALYYFERGKKVIYLKFDPTKNTADAQNNPNLRSIDDYLKSKVSLPEIIRKGKPDTILLTKNEPMMKELVKSHLMEELWVKLNLEYDVIIIDSPSIIHNNYAPNLAALADMTILVINSPMVGKNLVDESLTELIKVGDKPYGIVLNCVSEYFLTDQRTKLEHRRSRKKGLFSWLFSKIKRSEST